MLQGHTWSEVRNPIRAREKCRIQGVAESVWQGSPRVAMSSSPMCSWIAGLTGCSPAAPLEERCAPVIAAREVVPVRLSVVNDFGKVGSVFQVTRLDFFNGKQLHESGDGN